MSYSPVCVAYAVFLGIAASVWHFVAKSEFSVILTIAGLLQCLAFITLAMQTISSSSAAGISARSLVLEAAALCCRLSSTTWLQGYLPIDASGDWIHQSVDVCSVLVVLWLLREVLVTRRSTYQKHQDTFDVLDVTIVAFVLAALLHADMNDRPVFDALWMVGLFLGVVAVLPQLWLITHTGGKVEALTSHYIAMMALGRLCSGLFMWHARHDITCVPWVAGVNHAAWAILLAHLVHILLLADFAFIYIRTMITQGLQARLEVECGGEYV